MPLKVYNQIIAIMLEVKAIRVVNNRLFYAGPISQPRRPLTERCEKCGGAGPVFWSDDFDGAICEGCH